MKKKKGIGIMWTVMLLPIMVILLIGMIDVGKFCIYKANLQKSADAMSTAGAKKVVSNINNYVGAKWDISINKDEAKKIADDLFKYDYEIKNYNNLTKVYNFENYESGKTVADLYNNGIFNVTLKATYKESLTGIEIPVKVTSTAKSVGVGNKTYRNDITVDDNNIIIKSANGSQLLKVSVNSAMRD